MSPHTAQSWLGLGGARSLLVPLPGDGELTELPVPPLPPRAFGDSVLPLLSTKDTSIFVKSPIPRNDQIEIRKFAFSLVKQGNQEEENLLIRDNRSFFFDRAPVKEEPKDDKEESKRLRSIFRLFIHYYLADSDLCVGRDALRERVVPTTTLSTVG